MTFGLLCIGCIVVVSVALDGKVTTANHAAVTAGNGLLKAALFLQLLILLAFTILIWRFRTLSKAWDVHWDEKRGTKRTWTNLINAVLMSLCLLGVRQIYYLIRFLLDWTGVPALALLFDASTILVVTIVFLIYHPGKCLPKGLTTLRFDKEAFRPQAPKVVVASTASTASRLSAAVSYA
jgi:uncharacterized membrane protein